MDETSMTTVRQELANDIYELTTQHTEEINKMLDEFEDQQIATAVQLNAYEKEHRQNEGEQEQSEDVGSKKEESGSSVPLHKSHQEEARLDAQQEEAESTQQSDHGQHSQEQVAPVDTEAQEEEESNLFNILNEDVSDIGEDY